MSLTLKMLRNINYLHETRCCLLFSLIRSSGLLLARSTIKLRCDKDSLLDQTLVRLLWAHFFTKLLPWPPSFLGQHNQALAWILLSQYRENPSSLVSDHPSLPSVSILLGQFRKNSLYPWCLLFVIFHLLTPTPIPICSLAINPHLFLLYSELSSVLWGYFSPITVVPEQDLFLSL